MNVELIDVPIHHLNWDEQIILLRGMETEVPIHTGTLLDLYPEFVGVHKHQLLVTSLPMSPIVLLSKKFMLRCGTCDKVQVREITHDELLRW